MSSLEKTDTDTVKKSISISYLSSALEKQVKAKTSLSTDVAISKLKQSFVSFQNIIHHCGIYAPILQIIKDELYDAVYSSKFTSLQDKHELERIPYFVLHKRFLKEQEEKVEHMLNQINSLENENNGLTQKLRKKEKTIKLLDDECKESMKVIEKQTSQLKNSKIENERTKALFKSDLEKQNKILEETINQLNTSKSLNNKLLQDLDYANKYKTIYNNLNERFSLDAEQRSPMRKLKFSNIKTIIQSHIGVADKLEEQIITLQAKAINELDESVVCKKSKYMTNNYDEEETKNIQTQMRQNLTDFQRITTDSTHELKMVRQQNLFLNEHLNEVTNLHNFDDNKSKKMFMRSELFESQEKLLSKYSYMLYTSTNEGKTFDELSFGKYCVNCGGKTVICPHKLTIESSVIKLPLNSTHLMIKRPFIKWNLLRSCDKKGSLKKEMENYNTNLEAELGVYKDFDKNLKQFVFDIERKLQTVCESTCPDSKINKNKGISRRRYIQEKNLLDIMEDVYAATMWEDMNIKDDSEVLSIRNFFIAMLENRYQKPDISASSIRDIVTSVVNNALNNKVLLVFALTLSGAIEGTVFRYVHTVAGIIKSVKWEKTSDFSAFCRIVYPFMCDEELEMYVLDFNSFGDNKISKSIVFNFTIDSILKQKEPRIQDALSVLEISLEKIKAADKENMKPEIFKNLIESMLPVANFKLVDRLLEESKCTSKLNCDILQPYTYPIQNLKYILAYISIENVWRVLQQNIQKRMNDIKSRPVTAHTKLEAAENVVNETGPILTMEQIIEVSENVSKWQTKNEPEMV